MRYLFKLFLGISLFIDRVNEHREYYREQITQEAE